MAVELDKKKFQREEKHKEINANKQATQLLIQSTCSTLKNISQQKQCKAFIDPKHTHTHTHTHTTSLTNFIFQKQVKTV